MRANATDMTSGNVLGHILRFTVPLLIGNLFQQLYNMVDSLVVGNYVGERALAAVGTCSSMNFLFFSLCGGLSVGIGIIVAQFFGAKDEQRVRVTIANSYLVLIASGLLVSVLGILLAPALLRMLQTPDHIIHDSVIYMQTTSCGIVAIALYNGIAAIMRALGDSKTPLYFLIFSSVVNVALDLTFVLFFQWGVFGVALATIISQYASAFICYLYARRKISYFQLTREELRPNRVIIEQSFRLGIPVAFQNSMIAVSMMVLQGVVNSFGETVMAAYTVVSRVEQIVHQPFTSLGTAVTNFSGQNIGANQIERVRKGFRLSTLVVLLFSIVMVPVAFLLGSQIVGCFVDDPEVIRLGATALRISSLCYFGLGMIYVPRSVLNGCGDTAFSMINGVTEVACRIIYSNVFTRIPVISYWGIWITTGFTWVTTAVICLLRYRKGSWKYKRVVGGR